MYYIYFAGGSYGTGRGQNFGALQNPKRPESLGFIEEFFRGSLLAWQVFRSGPYETKQQVLEKMREVYAAKGAGTYMLVTDFELKSEGDFAHAYDFSKKYYKAWVSAIKKKGYEFDVIEGANGWVKEIITKEVWNA